MPKTPKVKIWTKPRRARLPKFFLTNTEKKDGETLRIQQWLDLADIALEQTGDDDELLPFKKRSA